MKAVEWESPESELRLNPATPLSQRVLLESIRDRLPEHPGLLLFLTSGTTSVGRGVPKWVAIRKRAFLDGALASNEHLQSNHSDIWLNVLPEFHVGGAAIHARAYLSGARVERPASLVKWEAAKFCRAAARWEATLSSLVPAQVHDLVRLGLRSPPDLRAILVGGGALAPGLYAAARELGWKVLPTYGMTEASSQVATADLASLEAAVALPAARPPELIDAQTVAGASTLHPLMPPLRLLSHLEARTGEGGHLELRGASLLEGYFVLEGGVWNLVDPKAPGGWFRTEDLATVESRVLNLAGRVADRIKIGGESVDLFRLRQVLEEEKAALKIAEDLAIMPITDSRLENVIELVRTGADDSEAMRELIARFNARVYPFERIRSVRKTRKIARTALGKLKVSGPERRP